MTNNVVTFVKSLSYWSSTLNSELRIRRVCVFAHNGDNNFSTKLAQKKVQVQQRQQVPEQHMAQLGFTTTTTNKSNQNRI